MRNQAVRREKIGFRFTEIMRSDIALLLAVFVFMLESCTMLDASTIQYAGAPRFPSTSPAAVEILREEPKQPNERLGEIVIDASVKPAPSVSEVEERLRTEAGKLGADAVVVVYDSVQPIGVYVTGPWWGGTATTRSGRQLIGVAIKYQGEATQRPG